MERGEALAVLGLAHPATPEEIKAAYRARARLLHPDAHTGRGEDLQAEATQAMRHLTEAYDTLCGAAHDTAVQQLLDDLRRGLAEQTQWVQRQQAWWSSQEPNTLTHDFISGLLREAQQHLGALDRLQHHFPWDRIQPSSQDARLPDEVVDCADKITDLFTEYDHAATAARHRDQSAADGPSPTPPTRATRAIASGPRRWDSLPSWARTLAWLYWPLPLTVKVLKRRALRAPKAIVPVRRGAIMHTKGVAKRTKWRYAALTFSLAAAVGGQPNDAPTAIMLGLSLFVLIPWHVNMSNPEQKTPARVLRWRTELGLALGLVEIATLLNDHNPQDPAIVFCVAGVATVILGSIIERCWVVDRRLGVLAGLGVVLGLEALDYHSKRSRSGPIYNDAASPPRQSWSPARPAVPSVIGLTFPIAGQVLMNAGFRPEQVRQGGDHGHVVRQQPVGGSTEHNGTVAIYGF